MLYPNCPTCGFCLADIQPEFERKKEEICNDPKTTETEKEKLVTELVNSMNLRRYCCKMRLITYVDLVAIIK
ncbi:hypothetical protein CPAV1605_547 [seawater metagenome]|uniref:Uncharacterized protein n=1 Tax=seawater metagenome TaxID=1561972 RepID=A0A5E8CLP4_9ZZZZ